jgi:hypothetical protein
VKKELEIKREQQEQEQLKIILPLSPNSTQSRLKSGKRHQIYIESEVPAGFFIPQEKQRYLSTAVGQRRNRSEFRTSDISGLTMTENFHVHPMFQQSGAST